MMDEYRAKNADNTRNRAETKLIVLAVGVEEIVPTLEIQMGDGAQIISASDLAEGTHRFETSVPNLLIIGLDGDGWKLTPLIHLAGYHGIPVLSVASNQDIAATVRPVKWSIDRAKPTAIATIAERLLADPTFVPADRASFPPPAPPSVASELPTVTPPSHLVNAGDQSERMEAWRFEERFDVFEDRVKTYLSTINELHVSKLESHAGRIGALETELDNLIATTQSMRADLSDVVSAVASERSRQIDELREMILTVSADSDDAVGRLEARVKTALQKTDAPPGAPDPALEAGTMGGALRGMLEKLSEDAAMTNHTLADQISALSAIVERHGAALSRLEQFVAQSQRQQAVATEALMKRLSETESALHALRLAAEERDAATSHLATLESRLLAVEMIIGRGVPSDAVSEEAPHPLPPDAEETETLLRVRESLARFQQECKNEK